MSRKKIQSKNIPVKSILIPLEGETGIPPFSFLFMMAGAPVSFRETHIIHKKNEPEPQKIPDPDIPNCCQVIYQYDHDVEKANSLDYELHRIWEKNWKGNGTEGDFDEAKSLILQLMKLYEEYGVYSVPICAKHLHENAYVYNPRSDYSVNFSPFLFSLPFTEDEMERAGEEDVASMFASVICGNQDAKIYQAKFVVDGDQTLPYGEVLREAEGMFEKYNNIVTKQFAKDKAKKSYQTRNFFDPEEI